MKTRIFLFAAVLCCIFITQRSQAQVTSVNYRLVYNVDSCWYDALLIINAGSATTPIHRTQFNSQLSLVVPTGTTVSIPKRYLPYVGNFDGLDTEGTGTPTGWNITSVIYSPDAAPESDFYSIVPVTAPPARYKNISSGDTIKLFSIRVSSITKCGSGIHLFRNGLDPASDEEGMEGSDFNNGFVIGANVQIYNSNSTQLHPPSPVLVNALTSCSNGIEIDLTATTSACQSPLTYKWTTNATNNYTSTTQDVSIIPSTLADIGNYKVVVTDSLGCKDSLTILASSKPNAGIDQTVCAGTVANIAGTAPITGTWTAQPGNPAGAILGLLPLGTASVTFSNAASGTYKYIYSTTSCSDTMAITVNPKPTVNIAGVNAICVGFTTTLFPTTGGTWVSNLPLVATVDAITGVVTAVSQGTATFTFTNTATGCFSTTLPVTINPGPTVAVTGTPAVCIGSTTTVTPTTGGTWVSSNLAIATVTNAGLVTGITNGSVTLTFTETATGCISLPLTITVTPSPTVNISGQDSICILTTTTLTPSTGGTWSSSNPAVATVSNSGIVTGLTAGIATFIWTETNTGCMSLPTDTVWVLPRPIVTLGAPVICVGSFTTLTPSTGGTWASNNPLIASVNATTGIVTGVSSGTVSFTFTNSTTLCSSTTSNLTVNPRPTVSAGNLNICIGSTTNLLPGIGGTWSSGTPSVATVTLAGLVTGITSGSSIMTFTETSTGCINTLTINVTPSPTVSIAGLNEICVGFTTTLLPNTGGTWASTNPSVASVNNAGLVTGLSVGTAQFIFTSTLTGCSSLPTGNVTVKNKPVVAITGGANLCIGGTTTLSPSTGGTWTSSNILVATVTNTGIVTAFGPGSATFTFTETGGCVSSATSPVTVAILPPTSFTGPNNICVGFTTTLSPTTGGTWTSSNPAVASVTNAGLVTGLSAGTSNFVFKLTATGCTSIALTGTVSPKPTSSLAGPNPICIDSTTQLNGTPSGGTWTSDLPSIATVTNAGKVTGVSQGTAIFTYTSAAGCASDPITSIAVMPKPVVNITGPDEICIDGTTNLSPSSGGVWTSSNPTIATVTNAGVVTGVSIGIVTFSFKSTEGCVSAVTDVITVNPRPIAVINGSNSICVGNTTQLSPTTGGSWVSSDPLIANISNGGLVTGVSVGVATFTYTNTLTGCSSNASLPVAITAGPTVSITGDSILCIGETTTMAAVPTSAGTWLSSNPAIATVSSGGLVTAVAQGIVTIRFRDVSGCLSQPSAPITVNGRPTISISSATVCAGGTMQLSPSTGGTWASSNDLIATVTNDGLVSGVSVGTVTFTFTLTATGCSSLATEPVSIISPSTTAAIDGLTNVCVGGTTTLTPTSGGVWVSNNPSVATVTNEGIVTSIGPGKVTFTFTETATGCASASATDTLTVSHCFNPDFNATFVNVSVPGNVRTNDNVPLASTYGPTPLLISSPSGSIPVINVLSDGTYTFVANLVGVYRYEVPVCTPPLVSGCPRSELTITVADHLSPLNRPVANVDFATTKVNLPVTLATLANDGCVRVTGCDLAEASVTVAVAPLHGTTAIDNLTGDITYTPNNGYIGIDTLTYSVCVTGDLTNCATAKQIITVNAPTALNSTVAADDFTVTAQSVAVSGNVKDNDSDAENDDQTITAISATVAAGSLVLGADGAYTFTPVDGFTGPVEFIYQTIDDNINPVTAYATLHILVVPDLAIKVRVYLEGALMNSTGTADGRPLMRDNLRLSPFTGIRYIPNKDPYKFAVSQLIGSQTLVTSNIVMKFTKVAAGLLTKYDSIPNPTAVFAVTGQNAIVDWVFIELRSKSSNTTKVATRSALIQRDGDVVDLDGVSGLRFPGLAMDDYYVVVRHLKHLGTITKNPQTPQQLTTLVNFTTTALPTYDKGVTPNGDYTGLAQNNGIKTGFRALWGGDFDASGKVKNDNPGDDLNRLKAEVDFYPTNIAFNTNYDFAIGYMQGDYNMNSKSKFDNPDDDKNMLYAQVFLYPLNTFLLTNFDFLVEQLP